MIFKENFKIGSNIVEISTESALSKKVKEEIEFLIAFFLKELNHNIADSSAWKFNNGQIKLPIYVKPEFIHYFKYVFKLFNNHPDTFTPYSVSFFNMDMVSLDDNDEYIVKNQDFKFDTSFFRVIFVLEYIAAYLKEKKINAFLIESEEKYIACGNNGWIINPYGHEYKLIDSAAICFHYVPSGFESHKFGAIGNDLKESDALAVGKSLAELRVLTPQIVYLNTKTDLTRFAFENEIEVVFLN